MRVLIADDPVLIVEWEQEMLCITQQIVIGPSFTAGAKLKQALTEKQ